MQQMKLFVRGQFGSSLRTFPSQSNYLSRVHLNESKLSKETLDLIESRVDKNGKRESNKYQNMKKTINKAMKTDVRKHNVPAGAKHNRGELQHVRVLRSKLKKEKNLQIERQNRNNSIRPKDDIEYR